MRVVIGFAIYASIIEFEPFLGEDIEVYLKNYLSLVVHFAQRGRVPNCA